MDDGREAMPRWGWSVLLAAGVCALGGLVACAATSAPRAPIAAVEFQPARVAVAVGATTDVLAHVAVPGRGLQVPDPETLVWTLSRGTVAQVVEDARWPERFHITGLRAGVDTLVLRSGASAGRVTITVR